MPERNCVIEAERQDIRLIGRIQELLAFRQVLTQDAAGTGETDAVGQHLRPCVGHRSRQTVREALIEFELERIICRIGVRRRSGAYTLILREWAKSLGNGRPAIESGEARERP